MFTMLSVRKSLLKCIARIKFAEDFAFSLHPDRITKMLELLKSNDKNNVRNWDI